jgi:hypothetical protein
LLPVYTVRDFGEPYEDVRIQNSPVGDLLSVSIQVVPSSLHPYLSRLRPGQNGKATRLAVREWDLDRAQPERNAVNVDPDLNDRQRSVGTNRIWRRFGQPSAVDITKVVTAARDPGTAVRGEDMSVWAVGGTGEGGRPVKQVNFKMCQSVFIPSAIGRLG